VSFSYLRLPGDIPAVPGVASQWDFVAPNSAQTFDLMLHMRDSNDHIVGRLDYAARSMDAGTASAVTDHFQSVLHRALADPWAPLDSLGALPRDSIVVAEPGMAEPGIDIAVGQQEQPLASIVAEQAARHPHWTAIDGPDGAVSYRELNSARRQLARRLAESGVKPGDVVALVVAPPTVPALSAMLAVFSAGAGLLPAGTVEEARATGADFLIADPRRFASGTAEPHRVTEGGHRAQLPQSRLATLIRWQARFLSPHGRTLQLASPGSPMFVQEAFLTWARGGTLRLHGLRSVDAAAVSAAVAQHDVTTIIAPYRLVRLVARERAGRLPLADLVTPVQQVRPCTEVVELLRGGVRLHAQYVHPRAGLVAMETCSADGLGTGYEPALRELAPGVTLSVRAAGIGVLPRGVAGDIAVEIPGERGRVRFATGDRGRVDHAGVLRWLGARDSTLAWAGQSLNVPSMERYLAAHPDVDDVVVTADGSTITAHVTARPGAALGVRDLRLHLKRRLVPDELRLTRIVVAADLPGPAEPCRLAASSARAPGRT
jgi:non-ribosomal peptide synthetase component F